jgi:putative transposase
MEFIQGAKFEPVTLAPATKLPPLGYVPDGEIVLVRFIRSDRKLDIFGERFEVSKALVYSYVKAVILTGIHTLQVYLNDELVETFAYRLTAPNHPDGRYG